MERMTTIVAQPETRHAFPWWGVLLEALTLTVIGVLLLVVPRASVVLILRFIGIYFLVSGAIALVTLVTRRGQTTGRALHAVRGIAGVAAGTLLLLAEPLRTLVVPIAITAVAGLMGFVLGAIGIVQAVRGRGNWGAAIVGLLCIWFALAVGDDRLAATVTFVKIMGWAAVIAGLAGMMLALMQRSRAGDTHATDPVLGILRVAASLVLLLVGLVVAFLVWLLPVKRHGLKLHYWVTVWMSKQLLRLYAIHIDCPNAAAIRTLRGILYVNHITFLDIPVVVAVTPARFLSTAEVFRIPFLGWMADSIRTAFVERGDKGSGEAVRKQIAAEVTEEAYPPFVIFPEGRFGTATSLRPFHIGSFAVAAQNSIAYLPCALHYEPDDVAIWKGKKVETFAAALWRVISYRGGITAHLTPLDIIHPTPVDDPARLAATAQRHVEQELGFAPAPTSLDKAEPS